MENLTQIEMWVCKYKSTIVCVCLCIRIPECELQDVKLIIIQKTVQTKVEYVFFKRNKCTVHMRLQQLTTDFPLQITSETSLRNVQTTKREDKPEP